MTSWQAGPAPSRVGHGPRGHGRFPGAEEQCRLAIARNPRQSLAYVSLIELQLRLGKRAEAAKVLKQAQDAGVEGADLYVLRGKLAASRGDFAEAVRAFEQAAREQPEDPTLPQLSLGLAYVQMGRPDDARVPLAAVLARDPRNAVALRMLGDIAYDNHDVRAARDYYGRFLAAAPLDGEAARVRERVKSLLR